MPMFFINSSHKLRLCEGLQAWLTRPVNAPPLPRSRRAGRPLGDTGCRHGGTGIGSRLDEAAGDASTLIGSAVDHHAIHLLALGHTAPATNRGRCLGSEPESDILAPGIFNTALYIHGHHDVILTTLRAAGTAFGWRAPTPEASRRDTLSTIDFRGESNIREGLGITPVLGQR